MTFKQLTEQLTGRNKDSRKLGNNTYANRRGDNIAITLHSTDVLTFEPDETVTVTSGGWKTVTTKSRINEYAPHGWGISQERGVWHWSRYLGNGQHTERQPFSDGDKILPDGTLKALAGPADEKRELALRKRIQKFAALCASKLPLPKPSNGDCWHCCMVVSEGEDKGKSMGDAFKDTSHLESHFEEGYVVPSLVYRALDEAGYSRTIWPSIIFDHEGAGKLAGKMNAGRVVKRAVRQYCYRRFGLAASGWRSTGFCVR
jgi:hypothetical protein